MEYNVIVRREGKHWLAEFPDAPGCQTFATSREELLGRVAQEALEGWLEAHLVDGKAPPRPRAPFRRKPSSAYHTIHVSPSLTAALCIRWTRQELGLSQQQLADRLGVSQQQVAKLENPDANPSLKTIEGAARVLGIKFNLSATG